jgi:hypothetical protein
MLIAVLFQSAPHMPFGLMAAECSGPYCLRCRGVPEQALCQPSSKKPMDAAARSTRANFLRLGPGAASFGCFTSFREVIPH